MSRLEIVRTDDEVDEVLNRCFEAEEEGTSAFPGMSFEQEVKDGISWLTGETDENPFGE